MFDEDLKALWNRGTGSAPMTRAEIEGLLRPTTRRTGRALEVLAWTYLVMLAATVALALANLPGYRDNPTMLAVEGTLGLVAAGLGALTVRLLVGVRRIGRADGPLVDTVERRLAFAERYYEPWLFAGAATPWLLTLAITTLLDNDGGTYRINQPGEFVLVTAAMFAITYASLRFATAATVRELRALLHDLRAQALDRTPALEPARRRQRVWNVVAVVALSLAVLASLLLWWSLS